MTTLLVTLLATVTTAYITVRLFAHTFYLYCTRKTDTFRVTIADTLPTAFAEQGRDYVCPQCNAPRSRFAKYDVETGTAIGGTSAPLVTTISTVVGLVGIGILLTQVL